MELNGKKKLHALSLSEKIQVLEMLDRSIMSQSEVARRFQVSQPQISRICKNKEKLLADWCSGSANRERKRKRESKYSSIDEALLCWFHIARAKMWDVTGPMLLQKAKELADLMGQEFIPSIGWLVRWKRRNNVCFGPRHTARNHYISETFCNEAMVTKLPQILKDYTPENIFGCKEIPLLYNMVPGRENNVSKEGKESICVLLCVNICGSEKRKPMVVGGYMPRRFYFGPNHDSLPVLYRSSRNGWMTMDLFSEWLVDFDREMGRQLRSVALVVGHGLAHPDMEMANIKLVFLPPHDHCVTPLNAEIIRNFKSHYKCRLLRKISSIKSERDSCPVSIAESLTMLDTIHLIAAAWEKVSPSLVENCFSEAGFHNGGQNHISQSATPTPKGMTPEEFHHFIDLEEEFTFGQRKGLYLHKEEVNEKRDCEDLLDSLPTKADALKALGTLRRWFECNGSAENIFHRFYDCEEEVERLCCQ
ncbi:tigger transposable element-derived protein 3 [Ambystoma mexicanum]|uniref:tigger transposable element-derived protein 3 n=1 Tax=Ambystoma mexicanum TaxID=8296 RepID=UPI0037E8A8AA